MLLGFFRVHERETNAKSSLAILAENKNYVAVTVTFVFGDATRKVLRLMNNTPIIRMVANPRD